MKRLVFAVLACALLASFDLNAQVNASGTLLGTVTDNSGGVVPGAVVKATSKNIGFGRETKTNDAGQYRFDLLPIGTYEVRVTMKGFASQVYGNVGLAVSQATTLDASLSLSSQVEII